MGHYLGMDTHDTHLVSRSLDLHPGMVSPVDPGIYIYEGNKKVSERLVDYSRAVVFSLILVSLFV